MLSKIRFVEASAISYLSAVIVISKAPEFSQQVDWRVSSSFDMVLAKSLYQKIKGRNSSSFGSSLKRLRIMSKQKIFGHSVRDIEKRLKIADDPGLW